MPHRESLEHLFLWSEAAQQVLRKIALLFNLVHTYTSLHHLWAVWLERTNHMSQEGMCRIGLFMFTCWELWRAHCRTVFDSICMRSEVIHQIILRNIHDMMLFYMPKSTWSIRGRLGLQVLGLSILYPSLGLVNGYVGSHHEVSNINSTPMVL